MQSRPLDPLYAPEPQIARYLAIRSGMAKTAALARGASVRLPTKTGIIQEGFMP